MSAYLAYERVPSHNKTVVLAVRSTGGTPLGTIKWYAPWRRYTFHPAAGTLFDAACLRDIEEQVGMLQLQWKCDHAR
jgi:hypothetical protein